MTDSMEWYLRLRFGLPPRPEDRQTLWRIAPELFGPGRDSDHRSDQNLQRCSWNSDEFHLEVQHWLRRDDARPLVSVHPGSCSQHDCPLRLGASPGKILGGQPEAEDGSIVI